MNISDKLYARVSEICGSIAPFTGTYLKTRCEALDNGEIGVAQFKLDMRAASVRLDEAHAELTAIRFPKFKQRMAHAGLTAGIQHYNRAIPLIIEAVATSNPALSRKVDVHISAANRAVDAYLSFVYRDRTERVSG